ncbi:MAG TPA: nucleoside triphosphate pyrophosphohydrolase [Ktedonobacterales bacterium]|nr:nucleoside triphosphate pyrophosphohydrolase [Ktedonobacterales bacterium]
MAEADAAQTTIIVVGLGPGRWEDLTVEAQAVLDAAPAVVVRTERHPTVDALRARRPDLLLTSFDALYDSAENFADLYPLMANQLLEQAASLPDGQALIYAVPGHPLIGEESVRQLRALAMERGVSVRIVAGLSFVEPVCAALGLDPLQRDLQLLDATLLADVSTAALSGAVLPTVPAMVAQVYNRRVAGGVKLALSELYPDDWEITVVRWAGMPEQEAIERMPLVDLDRNDRADHLTTIYVPPLPPTEALRAPEGLRYIVAKLRAPDGCPWDREQTHQTLRKYVLEEAYEVAEVLDEWDGSPEMAEKLAEELGDLLLQVYLQAEIGDEEDLFSLADVFQHINEKLIRRHPHVFGDVRVKDAEHVLRNWEAIKRQERADRGEAMEHESILRKVPASAPALTQAYGLGRTAAKTGFTWPDVTGVLEKLAEEARELLEAKDESAERRADELGDVLFVLTRLADALGVQPEDALQRTNRRFRRRFAAMEERAHREGRALDSLAPDEWLAWWADAKAATA